MADAIGMRELLEAGCHFGHQTRRWNPKMRRYIHTARNGIHILDLAQTETLLENAAEFVREAVAGGGDILFVGTKKQAQDVVVTEARRSSMPFVITRWLGGTLTNYQTIKKRIDYMLKLERQDLAGELDLLPKREAQRLRDKMLRLRRYFDGLRDLDRLPAAVYVIDTPRESIAVQEAIRLNIPLIALCDTNSDPEPITYPIPSNDDAIRAIRLITQRIADAAAEGLVIRESAGADEAPEEAAVQAAAPAS